MLTKQTKEKISDMYFIVMKSLAGVPFAMLLMIIYVGFARDMDLSIRTILEGVSTLILLTFGGMAVALGFLLVVAIPGHLIFKHYQLRSVGFYIALALISLAVVSYMYGWRFELDVVAFYLISPAVCVSACFWWLAVYKSKRKSKKK